MGLTASDYISRICVTKVYDVARVTPLDRARRLSGQLGVETYLKREDAQPVHSFKIRGAYSKMSRLSRGELARGVLAASAGNHAQGVAFSAVRLGTRATIVMPETTPEMKIDEVRSYGAEIVLAGETYSDAADEAMRLVQERGLTFVPPYDDPDVIAGQGTVAREILDALPEVDSIFVPIGGGGFAAGVSVYAKFVKPSVRVYGVEPTDSDCMARSLEAGRPVVVEHPGLFADGVAVRAPGAETFRLCRENLDGVVRVSMSETCEAIEDVFAATRIVCEPAGALALAALKKTARRGETAVAIVSGANMNFSSLSFIAADSMLAHLRDEILADGQIDANEARRLLDSLRPFLVPDSHLAALADAVKSALADGVITSSESLQIERLLSRGIDRRMRTAEERMAMG